MRYTFYFLIGSQRLYGPETLRKVAEHGRIMAQAFNDCGLLPYPLECKEVATTPEEIFSAIEQANCDANCAGVITFMHTFSPSKMWIAALSRLYKPYCHLHTQFNREIPWDDIDMDFMNLNQSAHGDREHGFIGARLRKARKIIAGYWENENVRRELGDFMRVAVAVTESRSLRIVRFGDNMREVAVTEGDKVEAQIKLGWSVNTIPVGKLAQVVGDVSEAQIDALMAEYRDKYIIDSEQTEAIRYQARIETGLKSLLEEGGYGAFTTTFEDLYGLKQLPGLASQRLMASGYGFGGEGDWKTAAMVRIIKKMSEGLPGGTSFMEDYTYHLEEGNELVLGAHMLEICPSIAGGAVRIEVHDLSIGEKSAPARLTFDGACGDAVLVTLIEVGGRYRMIVNDIQAISPIRPMPKLPVAGVMWKPLPDLSVAAGAWILAGGAHHMAMSYAVNASHLRDFAEMMDIEFIHIHEKTEINELKKELLWNDVAFKLR